MLAQSPSLSLSLLPLICHMISTNGDGCFGSSDFSVAGVSATISSLLRLLPATHYPMHDQPDSDSEREREWLFISLASLLNKLGSSLPPSGPARPSMHQPSAVLLEWERRRRRRRILSRSLSGQMSSPDHRHRRSRRSPTAQPRDCAGSTGLRSPWDPRLRDSLEASLNLWHQSHWGPCPSVCRPLRPSVVRPT